jgi:hypothetical protein
MVNPVAVRSEQDEKEQRRKLALLKAVGLDRAAPEQRELAIAIANRYDLDLMLKHLVLVDGKPFITRDALLWIAHRSGQFDGMATTDPVIEGDYWKSTATVWRKDMSHPFVYSGRYPIRGKNTAYGPEMAIKSAESMGLRRAFNISAPTVDERFDVDIPATSAAPVPSLAERASARAQEAREAVDVEAVEVESTNPDGNETTGPEVSPQSSGPVANCAETHLELGRCKREAGHLGNHVGPEGSWKR